MSELNNTERGVSLPTLTVDYDADVTDRLTDNAINNILPARYLDKDEDGNVTETPAELFERVAENVAQAEATAEAQEYWAGQFEHYMKTLQFMPNSPTLMNAGLDLQQLSACFVLEPQDDMDDILETAKEAGLVFKSGGGVGYTFSHLRPKGAIVSSTKGKSSGPISFMQLFDEVCEQVKQGGKRRGAQMGIMRVDHPDIGRFITAKREEGNLDNFNISVAVTDEFKYAVENNNLYTLYDPTSDFEESFAPIEEIANFYHPEHEDNRAVDDNIWRYADDIEVDEGDYTTTLREKWQDRVSWDEITSGESFALPAGFIWDVLVDGAWRNGEPGLFYIDETNREHTFDVADHPEYAINATNPCAEQPLCNYEACNLGHINLSLFKDSTVGTYAEFDGTIDEYFEEAIETEWLAQVTHTGVRFLDNVATMSDFPLQEIEDRVDELRKIGLGVMGWAQLCYQCGIRYGSDESLALGERVMKFIDKQATEYSAELADERGTFGAWEHSKYASPTEYSEWVDTHTYEQRYEPYPIRNHNVTTVAPTGTTSMIADTSGGIEPVYNVAYRKNVGEDIQGQDMLVEFDSYFVRALAANGYDVDEVKAVAAEKMASNDYDGPRDLPISDELADIFVTTGDVTPTEHTMMQRVFQSGVDSGISKTINLPQEATRGYVDDAYRLALSDEADGAPIKGLTVYRDQSREEQVLTTQEHSDKEIEQAKETLESAGFEVVDND